jgi:hypothetical protein
MRLGFPYLVCVQFVATFHIPKFRWVCSRAVPLPGSVLQRQVVMAPL